MLVEGSLSDSTQTHERLCKTTSIRSDCDMKTLAPRFGNNAENRKTQYKINKILAQKYKETFAFHGKLSKPLLIMLTKNLIIFMTNTKHKKVDCIKCINAKQFILPNGS